MAYYQAAKNGLPARTTSDHAAMLFCERFGWSYLDYYFTPADVIERWRQYLAIEAKVKRNR